MRAAKRLHSLNAGLGVLILAESLKIDTRIATNDFCIRQVIYFHFPLLDIRTDMSEISSP